MVQQETNLCCRCCCCQPNINYRMQPWYDNYSPGTDINTTWYMVEDAGFLGRCLSCQFPGARKTRWTVHQGDNASGPVIMYHEKEVTCSHCPCVCVSDGGEIVRIPWCCCLPYLETHAADGRLLGTTRYVCDQYLCVPKFDVFDAQDNHVYRIRSDTCCFGCCVQCRRGNSAQNQGGRRRGLFRVPHQIREPVEPHGKLSGPHGEADVTDLWAGWRRQICTKQETLGVKFPHMQEGGDPFAMKATLVGATILLNSLMYDHE